MYLRVVFEISSPQENSDMDDKWLQEQADRITRDVANKNLTDEKFIESQKLKRELAPGLWREMKDWLREACEGLNKQVGHEVARFIELSGNEVTIAGKEQGMYVTMIVSFDPQRLEIKYESQGGDPSAKFHIAIKSNGAAGLTDRPDFPVSIKGPTEVGKTIIHYATQVSKY
jgi:hypothetical protein